MFGVSRYSVRDAFKVLETKGLVTVTPFQGVVVSELSTQEVEEIFVIRTALEQLALRLSMENTTAEDLRVLRKMCKRIEDACHEDDFAAMVAADTDFHNYVFQMSRNNILCRMINDLRNRCHITRYSAWSSPDRPPPGDGGASNDRGCHRGPGYGKLKQLSKPTSALQAVLPSPPEGGKRPLEVRLGAV